MLQVSRDPNLGEKTLNAHDRRQLGIEHFERNLPVVFQVAGEVDGRHSAGADLVLDDITVRERSSELISHLCHNANVTPAGEVGQRIVSGSLNGAVKGFAGRALPNAATANERPMLASSQRAVGAVWDFAPFGP